MRLEAADLEGYARGCAILGSGGGGDVEAAILQARAAIEAHGPVTVVDLDDLPDDALVMPIAGWGAPTVGIEKLGSGREGAALAAAVRRWFDAPVAAVMAGEIGGGNGVLPVAVAAELRVPLVDADGMGRAFPEGPQVAMHVAGLSADAGVLGRRVRQPGRPRAERRRLVRTPRARSDRGLRRLRARRRLRDDRAHGANVDGARDGRCWPSSSGGPSGSTPSSRRAAGCG